MDWTFGPIVMRLDAIAAVSAVQVEIVFRYLILIKLFFKKLYEKKGRKRPQNYCSTLLKISSVSVAFHHYFIIHSMMNVHR